MTRYAVSPGGSGSPSKATFARSRALARRIPGVTVLIAVTLLLVLVLPTISLPARAQTTSVFDVVADATTEAANPFFNTGAEEEVFMGAHLPITPSALHGFVRFDTSTIPDSATVLNATLRVYAFDHGTFNVNTSFFLVLESWGELTINWSNEPTLASTPDYFYPQDTSEAGIGWQEYEVTTLAQSWVRGPNYGMAALNDSEDEIISWGSKEEEFARSPELTVIWELPPYRAPDLFPLGAALLAIVTTMGFFIIATKKDRKFEDLLVLLILIAVLVIALGAWLATR